MHNTIAPLMRYRLIQKLPLVSISDFGKFLNQKTCQKKTYFFNITQKAPKQNYICNQVQVCSTTHLNLYFRCCEVPKPEIIWAQNAFRMLTSVSWRRGPGSTWNDLLASSVTPTDVPNAFLNVYKAPSFEKMGISQYLK